MAEYKYARLNYKLIVVGILIVLVFAGLIFDVWRTHYLQVRLENRLNQTAAEAAYLFLPDNPVRAQSYILEKAREYEIPMYSNSITFESGNPSRVTIKTTGEAYAYMAFPILLAIGKQGKLYFEASGTAALLTEHRGPVAELPRDDIFMLVEEYDDFALRDYLKILPGGTFEATPDVLRYWQGFSGGGSVAAGETVPLRAPDPGVMFAEVKRRIEESGPAPPADLPMTAPRIVRAAIITPGEENSSSNIIGFGSFMLMEATQAGTINGYFIEDVREGGRSETEAALGGRDFGLIHRGDVQLTR